MTMSHWITSATQKKQKGRVEFRWRIYELKILEMSHLFHQWFFFFEKLDF
jgi:hypothetical protein